MVSVHTLCTLWHNFHETRLAASVTVTRVSYPLCNYRPLHVRCENLQQQTPDENQDQVRNKIFNRSIYDSLSLSLSLSLLYLLLEIGSSCSKEDRVFDRPPNSPTGRSSRLNERFEIRANRTRRTVRENTGCSIGRLSGAELNPRGGAELLVASGMRRGWLVRSVRAQHTCCSAA